MESIFKRLTVFAAGSLVAIALLGTGLSSAQAQMPPASAPSVEPCQSRSTALWGLCRADGSNAPPVVAQTFAWIGAGTVLFPARQTAGGKMGYIDPSGKWTIPPTFFRAEPFSEGMAVVSDGRQVASIDPEGKLQIPWFEGLLYPASQGLACFVPSGRIELTRWGRLRQTLFGKPDDIPYPAPWWHITGLAGFMDLKGKTIIAPQFEPKLNFLIGGCGFGSAGYAAVREDGKEGLIDRTGRWVVHPEYDYLALVFSGNRKVVAMIADRTLEHGWFLDTVERFDGFMGPTGTVRWRETDPPHETPVSGGLPRTFMNQMLFPQWQQDLTKLDVSSDMLIAWVGSLALGIAAALGVFLRKGTSRVIRWGAVLPTGLATFAIAFIAGLLSIYVTGVFLLVAVALWLRALRRSRTA